MAGVKGRSGRKPIVFELAAKRAIELALRDKLQAMFESAANRVITTGDMRYAGNMLAYAIPMLARTELGGVGSSTDYLAELRQAAGLGVSPNLAKPASVPAVSPGSTDSGLSSRPLAQGGGVGLPRDRSKARAQEALLMLGSGNDDPHISAGALDETEQNRPGTIPIRRDTLC